MFECDGCKNGLNNLMDKQKSDMEKYGWVVHYVHATAPGEAFSYHTHGVLESFGHPDLEITLPLEPKMVHPIICDMVEQIKEGRKFEAGNKYDKVLRGFMVKAIVASDEGRPLIRILLPDPKGRFPGDKKCDSTYEKQLTGIYD